MCPGALLVSQWPRFLGLHSGRTAIIGCGVTRVANFSVRWFRLHQFDDPLEELEELEETAGARVQMRTQNQNESFLNIVRLQEDDSGVYFCRVDQSWGPGTELRVASKTLGEDCTRTRPQYAP